MRVRADIARQLPFELRLSTLCYEPHPEKVSFQYLSLRQAVSCEMAGHESQALLRRFRARMHAALFS